MTELTFYIDWLKKLKAEKKLSYTKLGEIIKYTDVGISKAIKNNTLSIDHVFIIAKEFGEEENLQKHIENQTNSLVSKKKFDFKDLTEDELSLNLLEHQDRVLNNEVMKILIDRIAMSKYKDYLIKDIKSKI